MKTKSGIVVLLLLVFLCFAFACKNRVGHKHSFGSPEIVTEATCTIAGEQKRTCSVCGYEQKDPIPAKGHTTEGTAWLYDDENHWRLCSDCDEIVTETIQAHQGDPCSMCEWSSGPIVLSGEFTVNADGDKVKFTKGNLYWDATEFKTEKNQYDFRTWSGKNSVINGVSSTTGTPTDNVGLFYWTKDIGNTYALDYDNNIIPLKADNFALANDGAITGYDVLTKDECDYLLNTRTNASNLYGLATITIDDSLELKGCVLLPDNWSNPSSLSSFIPGRSNGFSANSYTLNQWVNMENAGAVFLPTSGSRTGSDLNNVGANGSYWMNSVYSSYAGNVGYFFFYYNTVSVGNNERNNGFSVRLVKRVEN